MKIEEKIKIHANTVYKVAFSMTKNVEDTEDIFQEVFIKFMKNIEKFENEEHEKAWLIRVTINYCKMLFRKKNKHNTQELSEDITYEEKTDDVMEIINNLPQKYRIVIYLFYYEKYKISEISKILKVREGTVKSQLSRAREILKNVLEGGFEDEQ